MASACEDWSVVGTGPQAPGSCPATRGCKSKRKSSRVVRSRISLVAKCPSWTERHAAPKAAEGSRALLGAAGSLVWLLLLSFEKAQVVELVDVGHPYIWVAMLRASGHHDEAALFKKVLVVEQW